MTVKTKAAQAKKNIGEPVDRSKTYTIAQLRRALDVSSATLNRYYSKLGLREFTTPMVGRGWQIAGEQYFLWLEWRRAQQAQEADSSNS